MTTTTSRTKGTSGDNVCAIYVRISDDPTGQALGVERQERECRELAERNGWTVTKVYRDNDLSATTGVARPDFEAMLATKPTRLVAWHLDRLLRLSKDLERVLDNVAEVHTVAGGSLDLSTPSGRAVARTVTAWSQYEGEQKADRQKAAHRQRREQGGAWWGREPFGYRYAVDEQGRRTIELHPEEAPRVADAYERVARGETYASIARLWESEGVTVRGRTDKRPPSKPRPDFVRQLILSPRNAGLLELEDGSTVPGDWPVIVDPETWRTIVGTAGRPEYRDRGQGKRQGLLTGIARCGAEGCDTPYRLRHRPTSKSKRETGTIRRHVYGAECSHASAPVEWLDDYVGRELVKYLSSPAALLRRRDGDVSTVEEGLASLEQARKLRERLDELTDAYADGDIDRAMLTRASARIKAELEPLEAEAQAAMHGSPLLGGAFTGPAQLLAAWKQDMPLEERRDILSAVVREVRVLPKRKGQRMSEDYATITWRA